MRSDRHSYWMFAPSFTLALLYCLSTSAHAVVRDVYPPYGITPAVMQSSSGDTIFVHPGKYPFEHGAEVSHELTIIGVGGASANEIGICEDLCIKALFDLQHQEGTVIIDGLTMRRSGWYLGNTNAVRIGNTSGAIVRNCVFHHLDNYAILMGTLGSNLIEHNLFIGPEAGGIRVFGGIGDIVGNTFVGTSILMGDGGIATPIFISNIIYETYVECRAGSPTFTCNNTWLSTYLGCPAVGTNKLVADPLFCGPDRRDYHLLAGSPCLPENSPAGCGLIGAFGRCDAIAVEDPAWLPSLSRLEVSPNPSSGEVIFSIPGVNTPRTLEIYDAHGRQVDVLQLMAGRITWSRSRDLTRGIYFARVTSPNAEIVKFVLLR